MDPLVKKAQEWVNKTYKNKEGYVPLKDEEIDGIAGWKTVYALLRALQIELGITATSTNFGPTTTSKFNERFPNGIQVQSEYALTKSNIYRIVECGLWVKGYATGSTELSGYFKSGQGNAVTQLKEDAGCKNTDSTVTLNIMKTLMSMVQFRTIGNPSENTDNIRKIQQKLNYNYEEQIGLSPCDGLYGREMNTALIKALQVIEGSTGNAVDGIFGDGTKAKLPILPDNSGHLTSENRKKSVSLLSWCLYCNGYTDANINQEIWDSNLANLILQFQADNILSEDGIVGADVWMALLLSTGNPSRSANGCDTRFRMFSTIIDYLKSQNYIVVGRYLTGGNYKQLNKEEPKALVDSGIGIFLIFQEGQNKDFFTETNGKYDAESAINAAKKYGIPNGNIIYFAVDFDATDSDILSNLMPYFAKIKEVMQSYNNPFKIGIYGTRNVCQKIIDAGYAESAYLSSLSTGFSGNLGFKKPEKWNLDQFCEYSVGFPNLMPVDFDKVAYRGLVEPVKFLESPSSNGHAYLRAGADQYYLGTARNIDRHGSTGVYFTPLCSKLSIQGLFRMVTVPEDEGIGNFRLAIYLQQYNSDDPNRPIEIKDKFLYLTDGEISDGLEFDVIPGVDYKLRYELIDVGSTEEQTSTATCDVDIYITTSN